MFISDQESKFEVSFENFLASVCPIKDQFEKIIIVLDPMASINQV